MKLNDRAPSLQDTALVGAVALRSVQASMVPENQPVSRARLGALHVQTAPALSLHP